MWEAISEILNSSNGALVVIVFLICLLIAFVLVKSGKLTVNTEAVKIGARDTERNIIRQQLDYVWSHLEEMEANIDKDDDYDEQLGQRIILSVYKEYTNWISFNHISKSEAYIRVKQKSLVAIVNKLTIKEKYKGEEFLQFLRDDVKQTIYELIEIREVYAK